MDNTVTLQTFLPIPPAKAGVLSWVHIGDLHMRAAGEQSDLDLQAIVDEINTAFAGSISFVFLPGDNADHGDVAAYKIRKRAERDQDNALEAWPEHGLLATQLGPNKNGRKW